MAYGDNCALTSSCCSAESNSPEYKNMRNFPPFPPKNFPNVAGLLLITFSLFLSATDSLAYPGCPADITAPAGACGVGNITGNVVIVESTGSVTGNIDGVMPVNNGFAMSSVGPGANSINVAGSVTNNNAVVGYIGSGIWNDSAANLNLTIQTTGSVTGNAAGYGVYNNGSISSITNSNSIAGNAGAIYTSGAISLLTNNSAGTISGGTGYAIRIDGLGSITNLNNYGSIIGGFGVILTRIAGTGSGTLSSLTNYASGTINATDTYGNAVAVNTSASLGVLTNYGTLNSNNLDAIYVSGNASKIDNYGTISAGRFGMWAKGGTIGVFNNYQGASIIGAGGGMLINSGVSTVDAINNYGSITGSGSSLGISIGAYTVGSISNFATGSITGGISSGTSTTYITNNGVINGASNSSISNNGSIGTINNLGSMYNGSGLADINNTAAGSTIGTLNNGQGAGNSHGALNYAGALPANYNIIISSPTNYGRLNILSGMSISGATTFGIYGGGIAGIAASTLNKGTYSSVLSGVAASNLNGATKGAYGGLNWTLSEVNLSNGVWDLIVNGATVADTQQSLANTASVLQNTFTLQNSILANSFSYDCNIFGANDVCLSAGGRNTAVSATNGLNNTSALLIAAYRVMPSVRVGAYADQNLSVNNAGPTVNLGNNTPLIGLFGAWNERLDGTGTEVKVSAAYGQKNTTVTRQVVGTSEPGAGSSNLNSQGAQATAKYGFGVVEKVIISPYIGVRYTQNNMGGYTEAATSTVTLPLTYSALNTNATTALAGVGAQYKFIPQATVFASAGVETDTNTSNGTYSATGVAGLTPINFNANPVKTRPTATVGAYYDVEKNHRLGITGIYRQEPYQAVQTTTVMATYTVGL